MSGDENRAEAADALVETMLEEALQRVRPPDLTARVARELAATSSTVARPVVRGSTPRRRRGRGMLALVAAVAAFATTVGWMAWHGSDPRRAELGLTVLRGEVRFQGAHRDFTASASDQRTVFLALGDRVHSGDAVATMHLRPLGLLELAANSTVEVNAMEWTNRDGVVVLSSVTLGALAGAFTWKSIVGADTVRDGGQQRVHAPGPGAALTDRERELTAEIARLREANRDLELALARKRIDATPPKTPDGPAAQTLPARVASFSTPEFAAALAKVDWRTMGSAMLEMVPLTGVVVDGAQTAPPETLARLSKLNARLIAQIAAVMKDFPGVGPNGSFTHPVMAANQISAALESAGRALDKEQRSSLERCMRFYAAKDKGLRLAADSHQFRLQTLVEELTFKEQFYSEARSLLTDAQRAVLYTDKTRGLSQVDLFGTGVMMAEFAHSIRAAGNAEFASKIVSLVGVRAQLSAEVRGQLEPVVRAWADTLPADYWTTHDPRESPRTMSMTRVRAAAARQVELLRRVFAQVDLPPHVRRSLAKSMDVFVPYPRAPK